MFQNIAHLLKRIELEILVDTAKIFVQQPPGIPGEEDLDPFGQIITTFEFVGFSPTKYRPITSTERGEISLPGQTGVLVFPTTTPNLSSLSQFQVTHQDGEAVTVQSFEAVGPVLRLDTRLEVPVRSLESEVIDDPI